MRTLAHISDLHFGRHDVAIADALAGALERAAPDLIVISGDLTQRARRREFAAARAFIDRLRPPKLIVPGNHDIPLYNVWDRMARPFARYRAVVPRTSARSPVFADEEICVLGLNTVRRLTGKNGRVSPGQAAEIGRVFAAAPAEAFRILVTHHPIGVPGGAAPLDLAFRSSQALTAVAAAGVHLLLSGHHHRAVSGGIDATLAAGRSMLICFAGTAISTRTRAGHGNSFNLIRIDPPWIEITVMAFVEGQFHAAAGAAYSLDGGIWLPAPGPPLAPGG